ncbi:family 1 glycosylhydrolase [Nakamurella sp.]|uniref:family 1 glycosylhydrolase n=1 Tax=Nakamurella sp. TaxID=1869182 RepID=UPI003783A55F
MRYGVASGAPHVEGRAGRGLSVWDAFAAAPGRIADGTAPDPAIGIGQGAGDLDLLADLGVDAYRFSVSWPRVQPGGSGPADAGALDGYDALVDGLLARGIRPWVALYRWDLPLELMLDGGWLLRDTAERFGEYAALVADRLGDRAEAWVTLDDPFSHMALGHAVGVDAPGLTLLGGAFQVTHHLLLGHARAVAALRARGAGTVGLVNNHTTVRPASSSGADRWAAGFYDAYHSHQFADPVLLGRYPARLAGLPGVPDDLIADGDLTAIAAPLDFYGVTYEHPVVVAAAPENRSVPLSLVPMDGVPRSATDLPIHPPALERTLLDLRDRYPRLPPVFVSATGGAFDDADTVADVQATTAADADADTHAGGPDRDRVEFLDGHLAAVRRAAAAGVPVGGYFHWSLLDGWEGSAGRSARTGLVRVDPGAPERQRRASFDHFRSLIAAAADDRLEPSPAAGPRTPDSG